MWHILHFYLLYWTFYLCFAHCTSSETYETIFECMDSQHSFRVPTQKWFHKDWTKRPKHELNKIDKQNAKKKMTQASRPRIIIFSKLILGKLCYGKWSGQIPKTSLISWRRWNWGLSYSTLENVLLYVHTCSH